MSTPPPGSTSRSRDVVVCRPLPSTRRTAWTLCTSEPINALANVDFPAPETPSSTMLRCGRAISASASTPRPVTALVTKTSQPGAAADTASTDVSMSRARSAWDSTTTGVAPLLHPSARSRSSRPRSTSPASATTTATMSIFAASTCATDRPDDSARLNAARRGSTAATRGSWPLVSTATQSPVHTGSADSPTRRTPEPVCTSKADRSTLPTRPGTTPVSASHVSVTAYASAHSASQPSGLSMLPISLTNGEVTRVSTSQAPGYSQPRSGRRVRRSALRRRERPAR